MDEAGGEHEGFTVVCGWVSTVALWEQFEIDWKLFLASYKVPHFHMKQFSQSVGPFAKWKNRELIRKAFMRDALSIVRWRAQRWVLCYVQHRLFEMADARYMLTETLSSPYSVAGRACVAQIDLWNRQEPRSEEIKFVFEDGGPDKGGLLAAMNVSYKMPDPIFAPSRDIKGKRGEIRRGVVQLQAADLLAYELRKHRREFAVRSGRPTRKSFYEMLKVRGIAMATFHEGNAVQLCQLEKPLKLREAT
ncbi:MAG: hypothetical protein LAO30_26150 [Acidobacteriia bacterium]|nr:hypothetical protein [Terriglobia bacterium]